MDKKIKSHKNSLLRNTKKVGSVIFSNAFNISRSTLYRWSKNKNELLCEKSKEKVYIEPTKKMQIEFLKVKIKDRFHIIFFLFDYNYTRYFITVHENANFESFNYFINSLKSYWDSSSLFETSSMKIMKFGSHNGLNITQINKRNYQVVVHINMFEEDILKMDNNLDFFLRNILTYKNVEFPFNSDQLFFPIKQQVLSSQCASEDFNSLDTLEILGKGLLKYARKGMSEGKLSLTLSHLSNFLSYLDQVKSKNLSKLYYQFKILELSILSRISGLNETEEKYAKLITEIKDSEFLELLSEILYERVFIEFLYYNNNRAKYFLIEAFKNAKKSNNNFIRNECFRLLVLEKFFYTDPQKAANILIKQFEKNYIFKTKLKISFIQSICECFIRLNKTKEALEYLQKLESYSLTTQKNRSISPRVKLLKSEISFINNNSIATQIQDLRIIVNTVEDLNLKIQICDKLVKLFVKENEYEQALRYAIIRTEISETTGSSINQITGDLNLAYVLLNIKKWSKAFQLLESVYRKSCEIKLFSIAEISLENLYLLYKVDKKFLLCRESLTCCKSELDNNQIRNMFVSIIEYESKRYKYCQNYINKVKKSKLNSIFVDAHLLEAKLLIKLKNYSKAFDELVQGIEMCVDNNKPELCLFMFEQAQSIIKKKKNRKWEERLNDLQKKR
ncbi:MAG: hypothetical protein JXR48_14395 [Candidatus Delongbacteria bacterium]|nr:hypothetical protein [Candidatus Delongbacteria bacterium]MBN2836145.1 hypothetical protein [Candidatus Delongbacteria bacterium]